MKNLNEEKIKLINRIILFEQITVFIIATLMLILSILSTQNMFICIDGRHVVLATIICLIKWQKIAILKKIKN